MFGVNGLGGLRTPFPYEVIMATWIYHNDFEAKVVDESEVEELQKEGWRLSFRQPGECETPLDLPADTKVELEGDRRDYARSLGVKVDGRWNDARVEKEIDEVLAASSL